MVTEAALPMLEEMVPFEQSRRITLLIVTVPVPLPPAWVTPTLKRFPDEAIGPQLDDPRIVPSAVYVPLPRSRTMKDLLELQLERYVPSVIAEGEQRESSEESVKVTLNAKSGVASVREICTGTVAQLCTEVTQVLGEAAETVLV
jgi:hypothetical protein